ncbi:fumarate hydratase C-terminal domain-containing protein [Telmatospirillum sp. J64-1]|uniref:fumarate hydratase C-terminal domain-containing protein n=1 Tax=Telmatospirillum sp. J64-1 TaxID=2502183 RepID=UPI00115C4C5C|nr:fumarate hydratase C-terminal domain-containing protein [Telmatospirillum sp. J64-1]
MATGSGKIRRVSLNTPVTEEALRDLKLGDVVYLNGVVYTGREGVYKQCLEDGVPLPENLAEISNVNFHCSPAATPDGQGGYNVGALSGTASFRFAKWLDRWFKASGAKIIIGKGGMSSEDYRKFFVPNRAIYLTTVGYGTGALLGRGVKGVRKVHWLEELGLAQAMWMFEVEELGPFIVESDLDGNSLFERENAAITKNFEKLYEGTRPATLRRYGETDNRSDEVI